MYYYIRYLELLINTHVHSTDQANRQWSMDNIDRYLQLK